MIKYKKLLHNLIIIYPLINIIVCYAFNGDNMIVFSWLYCMALCVLGILIKGIKLTKPLLITVPFLLLTALIAFFRDTFTRAVDSLSYTATVIYLLLFSGKRREFIDVNFLIKQSNLYIFSQALYIAILLFWVSRHGLRAGWNTFVLQGPYNYPHTLSYILLLLLMGDLPFFLKGKKKIYVILAGVSTILIFMTAVRTALFSAAIVYLYFFRELLDKKKLKNLFIVVSAIAVVAIIAERYGLLNALMQKTSLAVANNSFSNGRPQIAISSLRTFENYNGNRLFGILFGTGLTKLMNNNYMYMGASIHAHNDFIDIIVSYGIVNFFIYIYAFLKFSKKATPWFVVAVGILAAGNGLYMYIDCVSLLVLSRLYFESGEKIGDWSVKRLFVKRKRIEHAKNSVRV